MPIDFDSVFSLLRDVVRALDEKKAVDLRVLKVSEQSSITDYLVVATGTSEPHLRALRVELEKVLDSRGARIAGMDTGEPGCGWTVVDAYQIMIHLFTGEKREAYRLENLWKDAESIEVLALLRPQLVAKSAKPSASRRITARRTVSKKAVGKKPASKSDSRKKLTVKKQKSSETPQK